MGLDIVTRVTVICDKCGATDFVVSKTNDNDIIGILLDHLSQDSGWSTSEDELDGFCYCPSCKKTEAS